jgi:CBS domain-containing protein
MDVREGMSPMVLTVGPGHTLRDAARLMSERQVGAAVVRDPDAGGLGIITERDVLA